MNLEGKSAIVTGGSIGIGNAISLKLAEYGANVALNYRKHKEEADETIKKIEAFGRQGLAVQADVSNFSDADKMVAEVISRFGRIDILVNLDQMIDSSSRILLYRVVASQIGQISNNTFVIFSHKFR